MTWYCHFQSTLRTSPWRSSLRLFSSSRTSLSNTVIASNIPWFTSIPSFRSQVARTTKVPSFGERVRCPSVRNQVLFFGAGSFLAFFLAAGTTNDETFAWSVRLTLSAPAWRNRPPTNDEMRRARYYSLGKTMQQRLVFLKEAVDEWPQTMKALVIWSYVQFAQPVLDTSETRRWCWAIGALNGILYLAWHSPRTKHLLRAKFTHNPLSGLSYTMLTNLFSHRSMMHVIASSMLVASFGQGKGPDTLREATPKWHFLAFFVSAGLFSNLVSHVAYSRITYPRWSPVSDPCLPHLPAVPRPPHDGASSPKYSGQNTPAANATENLPPGIGASGVVYATLTVVALAFPDTDLALKIPPTFPLPITYALGSLIAIDVIGIWRAWRRFNHWAHLGGAAFGAFYWACGPQIWEFFRELALGGLPPSLTILPMDAIEEGESTPAS
ncbi:uncharacterized protein B0H18DRAFT_988672 [Fomitopsis serialis]|uniref:uncharacterized protein n=1 Tax=Fomitopsis serialis TaxID=139415 RepID=UPI002007833E|nr:uncharacterized protein B0H18DRAFT_988672 [Neoantrodia serialis]KAH9931925.1 hypothetical protein B0H18DRAFT_988672 [Neoantrodia serialis]